MKLFPNKENSLASSLAKVCLPLALRHRLGCVTDADRLTKPDGDA